MKRLLSILAVIPFCLAAQNREQVITHIKQHIYTLADDSIEGRGTGSKGEQMAMRYIIKQYEQIGVEPKGSNGWIQPFDFNYGVQYDGENTLIINNLSFRKDSDFFPLVSSGSGNVTSEALYAGYGIDAPELKYNDYKNINKSAVFFIQLGSPEGENPHSKYYPYTDVSSKIQMAINHGATGVILINQYPDKVENLRKDFTQTSSLQKIPIVFLNSNATKKIPIAKNNYRVTETVHIEPVKRTGHNIIAWINNNAKTAVVIGAHYDHLGYGEDGNSLYTGPRAIHNGADDNASGTAGVIELARWAKSSAPKNNNYLFINFSGEELGLFGSKYFVAHATIDTASVNYMINMDMIGRYNPEKGVEISGLGTSPVAYDFIHHLQFDSLKIKPDEHGTGPTDHTSFYYANIPVLNFFTGTHEDYHKPTDKANKINYEREAAILQLISAIIDSLDKDGKLSFTKTSEQGNSDIPSFKVRLGIIPDYMYDGMGLRVDGVNEGPGQKAGLLKGDVIIKMGDFSTPDIMAYMKALSMFQKGDKTKIIIKRNEAEQTMEIKF